MSTQRTKIFDAFGVCGELLASTEKFDTYASYMDEFEFNGGIAGRPLIPTEKQKRSRKKVGLSTTNAITALGPLEKATWLFYRMARCESKFSVQFMKIASMTFVCSIVWFADEILKEHVYGIIFRGTWPEIIAEHDHWLGFLNQPLLDKLFDSLNRRFDVNFKNKPPVYLDQDKEANFLGSICEYMKEHIFGNEPQGLYGNFKDRNGMGPPINNLLNVLRSLFCGKPLAHFHGTENQPRLLRAIICLNLAEQLPLPLSQYATPIDIIRESSTREQQISVLMAWTVQVNTLREDANVEDTIAESVRILFNEPTPTTNEIAPITTVYSEYCPTVNSWKFINQGIFDRVPRNDSVEVLEKRMRITRNGNDIKAVFIGDNYEEIQLEEAKESDDADRESRTEQNQRQSAADAQAEEEAQAAARAQAEEEAQAAARAQAQTQAAAARAQARAQTQEGRRVTRSQTRR